MCQNEPVPRIEINRNETILLLKYQMNKIYYEFEMGVEFPFDAIFVHQ